MTRVYVEAFATSDYGDSPPYATFFLTPSLAARLIELADLCAKHNLTEVREWRACNWGEDDSTKNLRLQADELVVSGEYFWFKALPKHCDYNVETRLIRIQTLLDDAARWKEGDSPLAFGEYGAEEWSDYFEQEKDDAPAS